MADAITTTAPARATRAQPAPAIRPPMPAANSAAVAVSLEDDYGTRLQQVESLLFLLTHLFGGDTVLDKPDEAPGITETVDFTCRLVSQIAHAMLADARVPGEVTAKVYELAGLLSLIEALDGPGRFGNGILCDLFSVAGDAALLAHAGIVSAANTGAAQ